MLDTFPTLHKDDVGTKIVGRVYGQPVVLYYPDSAEQRERVWRKQIIENNRRPE